MEEELDNGVHNIYVGISDDTGRILAKSNPIPFIKTAAAVELGSITVISDDEAKPSFLTTNLLLFVLALLLVLFILALIAVGIMHKRHHVLSEEN